MPVINNPEKQKKLINEKGQYEIDFSDDFMDNDQNISKEIPQNKKIDDKGQYGIDFPEDPVNNNQMKFIDRDSYFTEESLERLKPQVGINLDEEYNTEEKVYGLEDNLLEDRDDVVNISEKEKLKEEKLKKRIKLSKIFRDLDGKDLSYEDKAKIFQTNEEMSNLKGSIISIIHRVFKELYGGNKAINTENPDIKYIWDIVSETRKTNSHYVREITDYLNANKILGSCIKKLRDGKKEEVYKKLKGLYRSGHNSHEIVTNYGEYEKMLKILES